MDGWTDGWMERVVQEWRAPLSSLSPVNGPPQGHVQELSSRIDLVAD